MGYRGAIGAGFNPRQVPNFRAEINPNSQFGPAGGLSALLLFNGQSASPVLYCARGTLTGTFQAGAHIGQGMLGPAMVGSNGYFAGGGADTYTINQPAGTFAGFFTPGFSSNDGGQHQLFSSADGNFDCWKYSDNNMYFGWGNGGGRLQVGASSAFVAGQSAMYGGTWSASNTIGYAGPSTLGTLAIAPPTSVVTSPFTWGSQPSGFQPWMTSAQDAIYWFACWDRAFTPDQWAALNAEPFAMFRPVVRRQYYTQSGAAPPAVSLDMWHQPASQPYRVRAEMIPY